MGLVEACAATTLFMVFMEVIISSLRSILLPSLLIDVFLSRRRKSHFILLCSSGWPKSYIVTTQIKRRKSKLITHIWGSIRVWGPTGSQAVGTHPPF